MFAELTSQADSGGGVGPDLSNCHPLGTRGELNFHSPAKVLDRKLCDLIKFWILPSAPLAVSCEKKPNELSCQSNPVSPSCSASVVQLTFTVRSVVRVVAGGWQTVTREVVHAGLAGRVVLTRTWRRTVVHN